MNRLITGLVGAAALLLASGSPVSAVDTAAPEPPATGWYLSLGDSLAAGERDDHVAHLEEGSQLAQAEEFLHAHARNTPLITISLGANNVQIG